MTTGRKLLIGAGAVLIVGMLLVAAFALGVYVGEHGWTREGLSLQGPGSTPGKPPAGVPNAPGGRPPLPGGGRRPDLVGRVLDVFEDTLELVTPDGPRTVELEERTQVETPEGDGRTLDDLERGQHVAVFGHRDGDGQVLVAGLIVLLPPSD